MSFYINTAHLSVDCFEQFRRTAHRFNQTSVPQAERIHYLQRAISRGGQLYTQIQETTLQIAPSWISHIRFRQLHSLDGWSPQSFRDLKAFHVLPSTKTLIKDFDQAQNQTNFSSFLPSASLTDIQFLACRVLTNQGTYHFPVVVIYPGKDTTLHPLALSHFFDHYTGYPSAVTELAPDHPIHQHKEQTPVVDWMTNLSEKPLCVLHPVDTFLSPNFSDYTPVALNSDGSSETFNRVSFYYENERDVAESTILEEHSRFRHEVKKSHFTRY